MDSEEVM